MIPTLPTGQMEIQAALKAIRMEREPTRRGIMLCADMMGKMLKFGWPKDDLDSLEILYWMTRDGNGELLPGTSVGRGTDKSLATQDNPK